MTDSKTATERLREMLDARGVKWWPSDDRQNENSITHWKVGHAIWTAFDAEADGRLWLNASSDEDPLTPEQAVVITLGSEMNPDGLPVGLTISDDGDLLNWRGVNYVRQATLGSGTLTAEQVREAIERARRLSRNIQGNLGRCLYRRKDKAEMQEVGDMLIELANALDSLGSGECEWVLEHSGTLYDKWRCSSCGFQFVEPRCDRGYTDLEPNYCPNCGKKVKS